MRTTARAAALPRPRPPKGPDNDTTSLPTFVFQPQKLDEDLRRTDEELRQRMVKEKIDEQLQSPVRIAYYAFLLAVLLGVCAYELLGREGGANMTYVAIYGGTAGVMGFQLSREIKTVQGQQQKDQ